MFFSALNRWFKSSLPVYVLWWGVVIAAAFFSQGETCRVYGAGKIYAIQIGSFKSRRVAEKKVKQMSSLGHNAYLRQEAVRGKGTWYRVYIEKFTSHRAAAKEARILKKLGLISNYIVRDLAENNRTKPASKTGSSHDSVYYLYVGSFEDESRAIKNVLELRKQGYDAFKLGEEITGKRWFRVYMGSFDSQVGAKKVGEELKEKKIIDTFKVITIKKGDLPKRDARGPDRG